MSFKEFLDEAQSELFPGDDVIMEAVNKADQAFWENIDKAFPTLAKKDFDPKKSEEFKQMEFAAVKNWLTYNWPKID